MTASTLIAGSAIRVLIVDDHALVCHGLRELLSGETGMEVCGDADNADDALELIGANQPDLVIIDITLKSGNGIQLIKRIRATFPEVKMLVSSMHDEALYAPRALKAGAAGYVNKQEATETMLEAIRMVAHGKMYFSETMTSHLLRTSLPGNRQVRMSPIERLSDRELEVFEMTGRGLSTREIAEQLQLSVKTIETYREHIKDKLKLKNAFDLNYHAVQWVLENQ